MEATAEWLKFNEEDSEVRAAMKETAFYRRNFIRPIMATSDSNRPSVGEILTQIPTSG